MPQGLQVFNENGVLINDTNDRFPRIMGNVETVAGVAGEQAISIPANTQPIFFMVGLNANSYDSLPYISITNTLLKWDYRRYEIAWGTSPYGAAKIHWGYY
ncbi:hypothetical protein nACB1_038 [Acinetobacter phage nACB1]|nr:hypothetical protein nACB1_038 [Acinetobacter phage nACB1]